MKLSELVETVQNKNNFNNLQNYIDFSLSFLDYIEGHKQATIVAQNETNYRFFQFNEEGNYQVTRPFNSNLLYTIQNLENYYNDFQEILDILKTQKQLAELENADLINKAIYTIQQSIGFALDASLNNSQGAKKINGDLFERLILIILNKIGINCKGGVVKVPVISNEGQKISQMSYQHDLIIKREESVHKSELLAENTQTNIEKENVKVIGSVKVTSKDRIDKIFIDKHLFSLLSKSNIPHIAIFLHDVQRKGLTPRTPIH